MVRNLMEGYKSKSGTGTGDPRDPPAPIPDPGFPALLDDHCEMRAAVHRASLGSVVVRNRTLFAVAHRPQPVGPDSPAGKVVADRVGPPLAQREVVLHGSDAVAVSLDRDVESRVRLQLLHGVVQNLQRVGPEIE